MDRLGYQISVSSLQPATEYINNVAGHACS